MERKLSLSEKAYDISCRMLKHRLKYDWLIHLFEQDGVTLARTELSDILHGRRKSQKAEQVVDRAREFLDKYERAFVNH